MQGFRRVDRMSGMLKGLRGWDEGRGGGGYSKMRVLLKGILNPTTFIPPLKLEVQYAWDLGFWM